MTEEQKEYEALQLVGLVDKLTRSVHTREIEYVFYLISYMDFVASGKDWCSLVELEMMENQRQLNMFWSYRKNYQSNSTAAEILILIE